MAKSSQQLTRYAHIQMVSMQRCISNPFEQPVTSTLVFIRIIDYENYSLSFHNEVRIVRIRPTHPMIRSSHKQDSHSSLWSCKISFQLYCHRERDRDKETKKKTRFQRCANQWLLLKYSKCHRQIAAQKISIILLKFMSNQSTSYIYREFHKNSITCVVLHATLSLLLDKLLKSGKSHTHNTHETISLFVYRQVFCFCQSLESMDSIEFSYPI